MRVCFLLFLVLCLMTALPVRQGHAQNPSDVESVNLGEVEISYELTGSGEPLVLIRDLIHKLFLINSLV